MHQPTTPSLTYHHPHHIPPKTLTNINPGAVPAAVVTSILDPYANFALKSFDISAE